MTGSDKDARKPRKSNTRDARLAAALRENLRRRKAQERGRGTQPEPDNGHAQDKLTQIDKER